MPTYADENDIDIDIDVEDDKMAEDNRSRIGNGKSGGKNGHGGKKRGNIFRCESCSKVMRSFIYLSYIIPMPYTLCFIFGIWFSDYFYIRYTVTHRA